LDELAEKVRPRRFGDVIGQSEAVADLRRFIQSGQRPSIILCGPSGLGKTSLALLYAKAQYCKTAKETGDVCCECSECNDVDRNRNPAFRQLNGAALTLNDVRQQIGQGQSYRALGYTRHVYHIDEAARLSLGSFELIQDEVERPTTPAIFIFSLLDAEDAPLTVRRRCAVVRLVRPDVTARRDYLDRLATHWGGTADPAAVSLLASTAADFRGLAQNFDRVVGAGTLSLEAVKSRLGGRDAEQAFDYLMAAVAGERSALMRAIQAPGAQPDRWPKVIVAFLMDIAFAHGLGRFDENQAVGAAPGLIEVAKREALLTAFKACAGRQGLTPGGLIDQALSYWAAPTSGRSDQDMTLLLLRFRSLVQPEVNPSPVQLRSNGPNRPSRPLSRPPPEPFERASWLNKRQAREIYACASFVLQEFGVAFNMRVVLADQGDGSGADVAAAARVGAVCHRLAERLKAWRGQDVQAFHYVVLHERLVSGRLQSTVVGHADPAYFAKAKLWLDAEIQRRFGAVPQPEADLQDPGGNAAVARHWALVRSLWRGLSPEIRTTEGLPLVDALNIAPADQRPAGAVTCRRYVTSQSIGLRARHAVEVEQMGLLSAFETGAWDQVARGWELREHRDRERERSGRRRAVQDLERLFPDRDGLERAEFEARLIALRAEWSEDPRKRPRNWRGWWERP
jgi:hypothetical protein